MSEPTVESVRAMILAHVAAELDAQGIDPARVSDGFDLLAEGVVDSFGLVDLIGRIEQTLGVELDFGGADADDLTALGTFARHVHEQVAARDGGGPATARHGPGHARDRIVDSFAAFTAPTAPPPRRLPAARARAGSTFLGGYRLWTRARDKAFSLLAAGSFASFGTRSVIQLPVRLLNEHRMAIGSGVFIASGAWLQAIGDDHDGLAIEIGDDCSLAAGCVLSAARSIRLGSHVSFARNVYVADHTHVYDDGSLPGAGDSITQIEPISIGDGAWLGENVVVLPGVRIGRGAVVGANSVVGDDVPDFTLALGLPARIIRRFGV
jgi:acetyltransferase-like isoleucine patch superfamily enzyme/acyl carrier protein